MSMFDEGSPKKETGDSIGISSSEPHIPEVPIPSTEQRIGELKSKLSQEIQTYFKNLFGLQEHEVQQALNILTSAVIAERDIVLKELEKLYQGTLKDEAEEPPSNFSISSYFEYERAFCYHGRAFIRLDLIPHQFVEALLAHEVMEATFRTAEEPGEEERIKQIIENLGLSKIYNHHDTAAAALNLPVRTPEHLIGLIADTAITTKDEAFYEFLTSNDRWEQQKSHIDQLKTQDGQLSANLHTLNTSLRQTIKKGLFPNNQ